ncbi:MAG: hypothetical protein HUK08_06740 [Bacteroidaceae bacterium]|nr:hypothetical protein [Bacteroidaceae bacterium]
MIDFLRANSWCSKEEYMWRMTVGQVRLSSIDFSHVEYLDDKGKNVTEINSAEDLLMMTDLGTQIKTE